MVFITEGMSLRIPAGGLVIPLDGSDPPPVTFEVALDMWRYWLEIGTGHVSSAAEGHRALLASVDAGDESAKGAALMAECNASMVACASAAFAVDAFFASVVERSPNSAALSAAWQRNRTRRSVRISETLFRVFSVRHQARAVVRGGLDEVFRFRNWAVHPPATFSAPVLHPTLAVGAEWRFVAFTFENARQLTGFAISLVAQCLERAKPIAGRELAEWAESSRTRALAVVEQWEAHFGPLWSRPDPGSAASSGPR